MPYQTACDQLKVGILTKHYFADLAHVPVTLDPLERHRLTGDHIGKTLLGDIAKCLLLFRRINAARPPGKFDACQPSAGDAYSEKTTHVNIFANLIAITPQMGEEIALAEA